MVKEIKMTQDVVYIGEGENPKDNVGFRIWEKAFKEAKLKSEFGCSTPISFITSEVVKTIYPGKSYDENLNEIGKNELE